MQDLFIAFAKHAPVEMLMRTIKKEIEEWERNPTEEGLARVETSCILLMTKRQMSNPESAARIMAEMQKLDSDRHS